MILESEARRVHASDRWNLLPRDGTRTDSVPFPQSGPGQKGAVVGVDQSDDHAPPPLRIALFSGNYNYLRDGANAALNRLIGHTLLRGHAARVYSPTTTTPAFAPAGDLVSVPSLPIPIRSEYRLALGLSGAAARDVRKFAPSVIHVSAPDPLGAAAIRLGRDLGIPVIASMHTRFETYLDYYGASFLRRPLLGWLRRFYRGCDLVLAPSDEMAAELGALGVDATRIWSRGVDLVQFSSARRNRAWRRAVGIADHEVAVLFLGRLVAEKGLDPFRSTMKALVAEGLPIRPLVVGDGPMRRWVERELPNAILTGHLEGDALGCAVASADIFLNPSLTEAFGNVTLEAMASGVPVVVADAPSSRALIADGKSGVLVPGQSIPANVDAIREFIAQADRRRAVAQAGAVRARDFDWAQTLDAVLDAYREVQHERGPYPR